MSNFATAKEALEWITTILQRKNIPFQITGGLAGIVYGSNRPLNDIDIDIPEDRMQELAAEVTEYIEFGPARDIEEYWDLMVLTLNYKDQSIDLAGANETLIFNKKTEAWIPVPCNLSTAKEHTVLGLPLPVVDKKDYITYKRILNRTFDGIPIDQIDADAAEKSL